MASDPAQPPNGEPPKGDPTLLEQASPPLVEWVLILVLIAVLATTALLLFGDRLSGLLPLRLPVHFSLRP